MALIATYRATYGPIPADETWFGFLALVERISQQSARRILDLVTALKVAVGPLANEENQGMASIAIDELEEAARG